MGWRDDPVVDPFDSALEAEGVTGQLADVARSIYQQESGSGRNTKTSNAGAVGGMQIIPATFNRVADKGWNIADPAHNARAGIRYLKMLEERAGGDPKLIAAGYYGGEGAIDKARKGIPVSDPRNPRAPNTLQYGEQVASRLQPQQPQWMNDPVVEDTKTGKGATGKWGNGASGSFATKTVKNSPVGRLARGVRDVVDGGAQFLVNSVEKVIPDGTALDDLAKKEVARVNAINQRAESDYRQNWLQGQDPGLDPWRIGGNAALSFAATRRLPVGKTIPQKALSGATAAGATTLAAPVDPSKDYWTEKGTQVGTSAALGAGIGSGIGAVARMIKPNTAPEVKKLIDAGVAPTIGQTLGGAAKRVEDGLTSVPIIGDVIKSGQRRAVEQFNAAAINRALQPIGAKLPKGLTAGNDAVEFAGQKISSVYDDLLPKMNLVADDAFNQQLQSLRGLASEMPDSQAKQFNAILDNNILKRFSPNGHMLGTTAKEVDSKIGQLYRSYSKSPDPDHRMLANALKETQSIFRGAAKRANPQFAKELGAADTAYANLLRVENAAGRVGSKEGVFSPAALRGAVRAKDSSMNKRQFARGNALMQDLADAGQSALGQTVPDSGSAYRIFTGTGLAGLTSMLNPALGAGLLGSGAMYSPVGQKMVAKLLTQRPDLAAPLAGLLNASSPALAVTLPPLLYNTSN